MALSLPLPSGEPRTGPALAALGKDGPQESGRELAQRADARFAELLGSSALPTVDPATVVGLTFLRDGWMNLLP